MSSVQDEQSTDKDGGRADQQGPRLRHKDRAVKRDEIRISTSGRSVDFRQFTATHERRSDNARCAEPCVAGDFYLPISKFVYRLRAGGSMKTTISFWVAFFAALGAMFTISPRSASAREAASEFTKKNESEAIAGYFQKAWGYMTYGLKKSQKNTK